MPCRAAPCLTGADWPKLSCARLQIAFALAGETTSVETLAFSTSGFGGLSAFGFRPSGKGEAFHLPNAQSRFGASAREPSPAWHTYWFGRIGKC